MSETFPALATPSPRPITWPEAETFVVPATFGTMAGHGRARDAVTRGWLRPADVDRARMGPVERVFVPLWRIEGSADGFHLGVATIPRGGGRSGVVPTGGFRHHDGELLVLARRHLAIDPSEKVRIATSDLTPIAEHPLDDAERIAPDVDRDEAEYRYAGEATQGAEGIYHAAISARTGDLASAEHPPALRSVVGRLRRLFE